MLTSVERINGMKHGGAGGGPYNGSPLCRSTSLPAVGTV